MADDTNITSGGGLDRRSLLKKAAVGGAVVWVAPTLISSAAHAQGSSTDGTIIGRGFGQGDSVSLFSSDPGAAQRVVALPLGPPHTANGSGEVSFQVAGGRSYWMNVNEPPYCHTTAVLVPAGGSQTVTAICSG